MQKLLTVRIDADLLQELRLATVARGTTMAEIVRGSLTEWLQSNPAPQISRGARAKASATAAAPAARRGASRTAPANAKRSRS